MTHMERGRLIAGSLVATALLLTTWGCSSTQNVLTDVVSIGGASVHYTDYSITGRSEEAIVMVHGWSSDERVWDAQVEALSQRARVLTIDLPGHGQSAEPPEPYSVEVFVDAIAGVMDDADVARAVLIGHSNGVPVVRHFYRRYPARVLGLVAVDGSFQQVITDMAVVDQFVEQMSGPGRDAFLERMYENVQPETLTPEQQAAIWSMLTETPVEVQVATFRATFKEDLWTDDPIGVPLLAIYAESPFWTEGYEEYVRSIAPHMEYVMWTDVHHYLMMNRPDEFNSLVILWLDDQQLIVD